MGELQSYKPYARLVTVISAIVIVIAGLDASQVIQLFPEYASQINTILMIAGLIAPAIAQEKRVVRAEDLIKEDYDASSSSEDISINLTLDGTDVIEEIIDEDEDGVSDEDMA
jgi:hypothetical protein